MSKKEAFIKSFVESQNPDSTKKTTTAVVVPKAEVAKEPVLAPSLPDAKALIQNGAYLDSARQILDTAIRKKLNISPTAPIPDNATLPVEEVNTILKDTPYKDYYSRLKQVTQYYNKYGYKGLPSNDGKVETVAGTNEHGVPLSDTAYGKLHRSIRYTKLAKPKEVPQEGLGF